MLRSKLLFMAGFLVASAAPVEAQAEGFERSPVGRFDQLQTRETKWTVARGTAAINTAQADLGKRCLWLKGGDGTEVVLDLATERVRGLQFLAERWTARGPFVFRVEVERAAGWELLQDLSAEVKVGGFLTPVTLELPEDAQRLRFQVQSPEDTGVLIDELSILVRGPMELIDFQVVQPILPILLGRQHNPVLRLDFTTRGNEQPLRVRDIRLASGQPAAPAFGRALTVAHGFYPGAQRPPSGDHDPMLDPSNRFDGDWEIPEGQSSLWLVVTPDPYVPLDAQWDASIQQVNLADGTELLGEPADPPGVQRFGVAVRRGGDDDVPVYRIPGLVTTSAGTLIGVYDIRREGWRDLPGHIDVGMSRSTDGGRTWEPMQVIMDMGDDPAFAYDGVGDPAILVDRETGTIWVAATWHHGNLGWNGSQPGFDPEQTGQLLLTRSDDDGVTWSAPINITRQVKQEEWAFLLQGPGRGITMQDGTLVFPAQYQLSPEQGREPRATVLFSRDHGVSWNLGAEAHADTTEAAVVELAEGELMLNMRDNRGRRAPGARAVAVSKDRGANWKLHPTSGKALPEPVCMASLIHVGREVSGVADGVLLFSNPAVGAPPRRHLTIQASRDFGQTWEKRHRVMLDEGTSAGYSCLTMIDSETIGILYEGSGAHLVFQRIPLHELGLESE